MARCHLVGAGLAGLACAVRLAGRGARVTVYEAAGQAGGRCRSYFDRPLGRVIDNGNHLLLSGNTSALAYLDAIGARDTLIGPREPIFPFLDLETGARWNIRPNRGRVPWWVAVPSRRVPHTRLHGYLATWRLARAGPDATVADCLDAKDPLWCTFWDPLARAILNTPPESASAWLLWAALRESFASGGAGCRPLIARDSLSESLIWPALSFLEQRGHAVLFGRRLRAIERADGRAEALDFGDERVKLEADDRVVLAVPPGQAKSLLPDVPAPSDSHAIVNAHFWLPEPARLPGGSVLLGLVGGTAQWIFARGALVSLTVSAADDLAEQANDVITAGLWADTAKALGLPPGAPPPGRIVKERRATFAQTPAAARERPPARTSLQNLFLAGDWTDTGLPATIEGAIRSGHTAAALAADAGLLVPDQQLMVD